ncbi:HD-GYP domain-containing protein [Paenibacillus thermoaerophilus]|uniref:HD-GYP domain-containing protein n=1 Tax=Paenibacillus thermoaerophilus TaxID=1215385 RepID=A0ABW2UYT6_9BACL|nr:HD-GYP domain-containing protein [Paenibacillus thermoaerophilus]TMV16043.1 HD-GYP domain-containing protein [Paenibacillus thermoaerophilus]
MRLIPVRQLKPGMRLGKRIYSQEGIVLLTEYVELTQSMIDRLAEHGIAFVYIYDPRTEDVVVNDLVDPETRARAVGEIRRHFRRMMDESARKRNVRGTRMDKTFRTILGDIIDDLSRHPNAMLMLNDICMADHYLYHHSLNVCIYTTMLGIVHGYSKEELLTIGLGALLHDIGKVHISPELLQKPGKLSESEYELVKKHAEDGYLMLKDEPNIPLLSAHCALQHHERLDGSGYPRGLVGDEIHEYAQWIGIVDSYDAMTSYRSYRLALLPHQALEVLYTGAGTLYDTNKVMQFRDRVAIYPIGATVRLNTGEVGVVVDLNSAFAHRPIVRILQDPDGVELDVPYEVDLSKKLNVLVTSVNEVQVRDTESSNGMDTRSIQASS